jgi:hypothetical protein
MRNEKSNRLLVLSRLIGISGVFACMMAAIVYLLLQVVGVAGVYSPVSLYIIAVLAVAFVAAALVLRAMSNAAARAEDAFEVSEVVEDAVDEVLETCADAADEACETVEEIVEEAAPVEEATSKGILQLTPEKKEKIVKAVKKNAPVILAVAATAAISIAVSNSAKEKERARVRKSILDLLY